MGTVHPSITRAQHIESYLQDRALARSTRRIGSDDATHDTVFQTTQGQNLMLRVHMPQSSSAHVFPAMSLAGVRGRHAWCDSSMRITGYAPIQNAATWRNSGLKLGAAVHAVVKQLQVYPPEITEITDPALRSIQKKMAPSANNGQARHSQQHSPHRSSNHSASSNGSANAPPPNYSAWVQTQSQPKPPKRFSKADAKPLPPINMPTVPMAYDEVVGLEKAQLEKYVKNDLDFLTFAGKMETNKEILTLRASVMRENFKLANTTLTDEARIKELSASCDDLKKSIQDKLAKFQELESEQSQIAAPPDVRSTLKQLSKAVDESMEESEALAEEWVENGDKSVDEFCKEFLAIRTLHHRRAATMERLSRQDPSR